MSKGTKTLYACLLVAALLVLTTQVTAQQSKRGPSTPEERARAVRVAKALQDDPLAPNLKDDSNWIFKWLTDVPDINVKICTDMLGDLGKAKTGIPGTILIVMMASQAAFIIEHSEKVNDDASLYLAGVESALRAYEVIRKKDSSYHPKHLDELIVMRDQGKLAEYVSDTAKKCKSQNN